MKLSDIIRNYRLSNNLSMDELALRAGLSKGYISMLENGTNPRNKKPINPTLESLQKISNAMGIDVDMLLQNMDSKEKVILSSSTPPLSAPTLPADEENLLTGYRQLNQTGKDKVMDYVSDLLDSERYSKTIVSRSG